MSRPALPLRVAQGRQKCLVQRCPETSDAPDKTHRPTQVLTVRTFPHLQIPIQKLQNQGLLLYVLDHLDTSANIARCSSVCRSWRDAAFTVQPSSIIPGYTYQGGEKYFMQKDDAKYALGCLSVKNKVGDLKYLK